MKAFKYTLLFSLFCSASIVNGQISVEETLPLYTHTIYRIDGSVLKGEITEWNVEFISMRMLSGLEIKIDAELVRKVVSRNVPKSVNGRRGGIERTYSFKEEGIYHVTTAAMSAGPAAGVGITHAVGYRFSRLLGLGAGIGAEAYEVGSGNQIVPLFLEARGFFMKQKISPYYALRAGYGFSLTNSETNITETKGGRMFGAELGYRFGGARFVNFFAGVGVHFQKATYKYEWPWEEAFTDVVDHRRTELKIGVIF